ncbi:MAG TPA: hypothetical protein VLL77_12195 [Anaerolineales bacterium]|nr:hypothetical protein [Anaerolineales bacterium]
MSHDVRGRSRHGELDLDQLVELQPGLGRLMPEVGRRYWVLYHAAHGGNWGLAAYQLRQIVHLFRIGSTTRPKRAAMMESYRQEIFEPLAAAIEAGDLLAFDRIYEEGIRSADRFHAATNHPEIRWRLPAAPPPDLDLGPTPAR